MDALKQSLETYKQQLSDIELAITEIESPSDMAELYDLRDKMKELIDLTQQSVNQVDSKKDDPIADEFALFMAEMEKEGATTSKNSTDIQQELSSLEGMKCRAPHQHQWGDTMYHNALVCSVVPSERHQSFEEIEVKVMFINPTHQEMLPCPYLMESSCKFEDDKCRYSHGEVVSFSQLQEYHEPKFELLAAGSKVLAKQINKLWGRATVKRVFGTKCLVKFESNQKDLELELHDVLPLDQNEHDNDEESNSEGDSDREDIINMSLMNTPTTQALGEWEKHTKGFGSKIMEKMGYVVGTGLGRFSDGRTEPVTAVVLPPGKSLDHCMNLREKAGGDKDLFSVEKKLKRLQRKQEKQNLKAYEREKKKVDVFNFLNDTLAGKSSNSDQQNVVVSKSKHRQEIKKESSRDLNVASLKIDEDIKRVERDLFKIRESLGRHSDTQSQVHKSLKQKLHMKQNELQSLRNKALNISQEQSVRNDKRKLTVF